MKEKKKSTLSKLMVFAGNHKYYVYASCILATISAFMALVPFYDIWRIIKEVLEVRPHFNEAVHIKNYGGHAVLFALLSMIFLLSFVKITRSSIVYTVDLYTIYYRRNTT